MTLLISSHFACVPDSPILHLHHCHGKPLAPVSNSLLPPVQDKGRQDSFAAVPSAGRNAHPHSQPQPSVGFTQQQPSAGRILTGISSAPMVTSTRAPLTAPPFSNGSSGEGATYNHVSNRNSLYGSPLLVSNIPLPPGVHNPLLPSPTGNVPPNVATYQPQTQYQPGSYTSTTSAAPPLSVSTGAAVPTAIPQPLSAPSLGPPGGLVGPNVPRPMSQQGFVSTSSAHNSGDRSANGVASGSANEMVVVKNLLNEMSLYGPSANRESSDRARGKLQQQHSQPQLQHRPPPPGRIHSQDTRSLSSDELKVDSKAGAAVKNIMKGMNAKWSEIRKTGMN